MPSQYCAHLQRGTGITGPHRARRRPWPGRLHAPGVGHRLDDLTRAAAEDVAQRAPRGQAKPFGSAGRQPVKLSECLGLASSYPQKIAVGSRSISLRRSSIVGDGSSWSYRWKRRLRSRQ